MGRVRESADRMQAIRSLLPPALRSSVQAGPLEEGCWCLLVSSNAVAAKVRQMLPALQAQLNSQGLGVNAIRLKVQNRGASPCHRPKKKALTSEGAGLE